MKKPGSGYKIRLKDHIKGAPILDYFESPEGYKIFINVVYRK